MKLKTPKFPSKGHHDAPLAPGAPSQFAPMNMPPQPAPLTGANLGAATGARSEPVSPLKKAASGLAAPTRQRNAAVMIAGAAFIILAAALAASVASSFDDSIEVLVASGEIVEGQTVTESNFRTVKIAAGEGDIQVVSPDSIQDLVGRVAAGPIGEGSMIHPAQFAIAGTEAKVVVGAALGPDQYPSTGLKPGDQVRLIEVVSRYGGGEGSEFNAGREIAVGEITDVLRLSSNALHFSIRVDESAATVVADRIAQDQLIIALVDESLTLKEIEEIIPAEPVVPLEFDDEPSE